MGVNVTFDPAIKIMYVTTPPVSADDGIYYTDLDFKTDFYSDAKEDWISDPNLAQYLFPITVIGGDPLPGSKALGSTFFIEYGWKIRPYEASHTFRLNGNVYSRDGSSPFTNTIGSYNIQIINTVSNLVDSTVQQLKEIEYSSFGGGVSIDWLSNVTGTAFPAGNKEYPVNNAQDAIIIAQARGFDTLYIIGNYTFTTGDIIDGFIIKGQNAGKSFITVEEGCSSVGCEFHECFLSGTLDGGSIIRNSMISNLNYINGVIYQTMLNPGTIVLGGNTPANILDCYSGLVTDDVYPTIDFDGAGNSLSMRNYNGVIRFYNKTGPEKVSVDINSGEIVIDSTVTNGDIILRGIGTLTDSSSGANVMADDLMNKNNISLAVWDRTQQLGHRIESLRGTHMAFGNVYYYDSVNGNDSNNGEKPEYAVKTFNRAHELVTDGNNDVVFVLANDPSGITTIDEMWNITKNNVSFRGAGRHLRIIPNMSSGHSVLMYGNNIEISGLSIETHPSNTTGHGCHSTGDQNRMANLWVTNCYIGVHISGGDDIVCNRVNFSHNSSDGILIDGVVSHVFIEDCHGGTNGGSGVRIDMDNGGHEVNIVGNGMLHDNEEYGLYIGSNSEGVHIESSIKLFGNVGGDVLDLGLNTFDEGIQFREKVASAILDTPLGTYNTPGTVGVSFSSASYGGRCYIDALSGSSGTTYPIGTSPYPVNNVDDALVIMNTYSLNDLHLHSDIILDEDDGTLLEYKVLTGHDYTVNMIDGLCSTKDIIAHNVVFTGIFNGNGMTFYNCKLYNCEEVTGHFHNGTVAGTIYLKNTTDNWFYATNSSADAVELVNFHVGMANMNISNWQGYIELKDQNHIDSQINISIDAGVVIVDSSCTAGKITIFGQGQVVDNSNGSIVDISNVLTKESIGAQVWQQTSGLQRLIESSKRLPAYGEFFYVNYSLGLSGNDGRTPESPVHSVQFTHDNLIVDGRGDVIFILAEGTHTISVDEQWVLSKNHFSIRGSGWHTTIHPSSTSGPTISITGKEVSLENFQVQTSLVDGGGGNQYCISIEPDADLCLIRNMKIKRGINGGVNITDADGIEIHDSILEHFVGNAGVNWRGTSHECIINNCFIYDMQDGVRLYDTCGENWIKSSLFHDMIYGVNVMSADVHHFYMDRTCTFGNLTDPLNNDIGGEGVIHFLAEDINTITQRTWDEQLSEHQTIGSAGYSLGNVSAGSNPSDIADAVWGHSTAQSLSGDIVDMKDDTTFIRNIEGGRWQVIGNQMVFFAEDNATEIARFNLYDDMGQLNSEVVFQRRRV